MRDLVHYVDAVFLLPLPLTATFFDLHVQCGIVLKFIFRVFCCCFFCFVVVICDLVHDVETVMYLSCLNH